MEEELRGEPCTGARADASEGRSLEGVYLVFQQRLARAGCIRALRQVIFLVFSQSP